MTTPVNGASILRADALRLPLADASVDLIVSSPPYFALRSYRDGDEHYDGQIGSEPTPQAFLEALWAVMHECWRVLKPTGSCFINLGDKRAGSGGHNNNGLTRTLEPIGKGYKDGSAHVRATRRNAPDRYNQAAYGRPKSKMLLPHRFAIGCEDGLADPVGIGWVMRQDIVWQKLNGLPESVTDRCRDGHEYLFHLTKEERYFSAVDAIRVAYSDDETTSLRKRNSGSRADAGAHNSGVLRSEAEGDFPQSLNPLGKLPGSVWPLASEPLFISDEVKAYYSLPDHFAAFPTELARRVVLGWSPASRSAVVLDVFGGTGTTAGVARALGRHGISVDLSHDYGRLAQWRIERSGHFAKVVNRTHKENQGTLL